MPDFAIFYLYHVELNCHVATASSKGFMTPVNFVDKVEKFKQDWNDVWQNVP